MAFSRSERLAAGALQVEQIGPLLVLHFPPGVGAQAVEGMMAAFDRAHRRGVPFACVLDGTAIRRLPGPPERQALAEWLADPGRRQLERDLNVGSAVVATSGFLRAFVAAIYFVRKPIAPQHWVATLREGVEWACEKLVGAGIALPPEVERARDAASSYERLAARR